jgi:hypothetical protein
MARWFGFGGWFGTGFWEKQIFGFSDEGMTKVNKRKKDDKGKPRPELAGYTQREDHECKRDESIWRGHCNREEGERIQLMDSEDKGHNEDQDGDTNDGFGSQVKEPPGGLEEGLKGQEKMVGGSEYGTEKETGDDLPPSVEEWDVISQERSMTDNEEKSFYSRKVMDLGEARDCVSWSAKGSNTRRMILYIYTRLGEETPLFSCTYEGCGHVSKALNLETGRTELQNSCVRCKRRRMVTRENRKKAARKVDVGLPSLGRYWFVWRLLKRGGTKLTKERQKVWRYGKLTGNISNGDWWGVAWNESLGWTRNNGMNWRSE